MNMDIKYINTSKPRKTVSPISFKKDTVLPAHTLKTDGFVPYIPKRIFDELVEAIKNGEAEEFLGKING